MSKYSHIGVLIAALASLFAVMSSTAGAATWTNSGGTNFHATGGPTTLSIDSNNLACSGSTTTGTAPMSSTTFAIMTGTIVFSPCSLVGQNTFVHCTYTETGSSISGGVVAGFVDLTCDARLTASPANSLCHIAGALSMSYTNTAGGAAGKITHASGNLSVTNGNVACPLGQAPGAMTEQTNTLTSVGESPIFARDL